MSRKDSDLQTPRAAEGPELIAAMQSGVIAALQDHKRRGNAVVGWDSEARRVVSIPSAEIVIPPELGASPFALDPAK